MNIETCITRIQNELNQIQIDIIAEKEIAGIMQLKDAITKRNQIKQESVITEDPVIEEPVIELKNNEKPYIITDGVLRTRKVGNTMLNELAKEINDNAKAHGWWDKERKLPEIIALCHSELSEALEEYRNNKPMDYRYCDTGSNNRKLDICCKDNGICYTFAPKENNEDICEYVVEKPEGIAVELIDCVIRILDYLATTDINIDEVMKEKMDYNKSRPFRHGNKVC